MRFVHAILTALIFPALAHAATTCDVMVPGDVHFPNSYDKSIFATQLTDEVGPKTSLVVFIKGDQSTTSMSSAEFYAMKDRSEWDRLTYITFQHSQISEYLISFGKVDAADNEDPLKTTSFATGALSDRGISLWLSRESMVGGCHSNF